MAQNKFLVKIPINDHEQQEIMFKTRKEICEFLDIGAYTLESFLAKKLKLAHVHNQKLKGITIERIYINKNSPTVKLTEEQKQQQILEYHQSLIQKAKLLGMEGGVSPTDQP
jgi:hypothetical protein